MEAGGPGAMLDRLLGVLGYGVRHADGERRPLKEQEAPAGKCTYTEWEAARTDIGRTRLFEDPL